MKVIRIISVALIVILTAGLAQAQVVKKSEKDSKKKSESSVQITDRQQAFFEQREPSDADLQWTKVVYRSLDLTKGKNPALYYPEEPNADGEDLFFIIMRLLANDEISAYEYLDGREMFTDDFKIKVKEMLERFHIYHTEAKGSNEKHPKFAIENSDIPANEILSYYIIEKWEFDTRSNAMKARVDAICPVLHRTDEFGGEAVKYPMFWVKLNDIRPWMAQQYVFTDDDNNLPRYNLDDFFKLNMYTGDIYKVKNLRNLSLMQMYPDPDELKMAQDSIEKRLRAFDKNLWVPSREELQAQKEAREKALAEAEGESEEADGEKAEQAKTVKKSKEKERTTTTKRGSSKKNNKIKQRKAKNTGSNTAVRSVRSRKGR
ncbi:MAG: gliding motility protein GldN [Muribaculaceae bacterium]|nr:gliding motility protein GldN [Muribaculaceae bacterium]